MGLHYPAQGDMSIRRMSPRILRDGRRSYEYVVVTDELDISPEAIVQVRKDACVSDATPYSRQGSVLCFTVTLEKGQAPPSNETLDRIAATIREHSDPTTEEEPKRKKRS